ncbi:hypothetical protein SAY87_027300 [Trapa incisa]|uniref:Major facilitator superfamily (MFS) profile domain-containing protein n=1 Tax=Trapa incisa TaxID=236973 RepID=A0AAN7GRK0_9MYRT|nr:hypothetical protein SAY87_027300 [Trapa incisa]
MLILSIRQSGRGSRSELAPEHSPERKLGTRGKQLLEKTRKNGQMFHKAPRELLFMEAEENNRVKPIEYCTHPAQLNKLQAKSTRNCSRPSSPVGQLKLIAGEQGKPVPTDSTSRQSFRFFIGGVSERPGRRGGRTESSLMAESVRERLLKDEEPSYHESCPGCRIDLIKKSNQRAPYKLFFFVWIIVLCAALPISSLFPFLYYMIKDFHIAKREEDIGFYAGYVGSAFMLGRALTSVLWGMVADRYGRKPVIVVGLVVVIIFNTLFGLSTNFWMAIATRFLLGSLCGILGPMRAYASEVCRKEHQSLAMSIISTSWGIGLVIGPAVGGFLAQVSLPSKIKFVLMLVDLHMIEYEILLQPADKFPHIFSKGSIFGRFPYFLPCLLISIFTLCVLVVSAWLPETLHKHNESIEGVCKLQEGQEEGWKECNLTQESHEPVRKSLLRNWPLMSSITVYCVFQLHDMAYSEIFSLWAISPRKFGGLSYSTADVGEVLAVSGIGLLLFQLFLYPPVERTFGPVMISRVGAVLSILLLTSYPFIGKLTGIILTLLINLASILKNVLSVSSTRAQFLSHLYEQHYTQEQRGAANGLSLSAMSLFKAIGPATGGMLFSWSEKRRTASFLPGVQMVFFMLNLIEALGLLLTSRPFLTLPE